MIDILAFGAHPDDIEFGCGGILAKMSKQGKRIAIVDLTSGEKGTHGAPEERRREGEAAARLIGAERIYLDFADCELIDTYAGRVKLTQVIRQYKPRLILAPLWKGEQNHPDHLACGLMARYACRYARFAKILPEIPVHQPEGILHYLYPFFDESIDFILDVSQEVETWKEMMACHRSQKMLPYSEWSLRVAAKMGMMIGSSYGQGLKKGNPIQIEDLLLVARASREI